MDPQLYDDFYAIERNHWWCVGLRRIFHLLVAEHLRPGNVIRLVDLGCGTGITLEEFRRYGEISGLDLAWKALEYARRRNRSVPLVQADLTRLPFVAESHDGVLAFDVIEHLDDDLEALKEIGRILRPGGFVLLNVPAFPSLWGGKDTANHHRRRYTRSTLRRRLDEARFQIERITYTNVTLFPLIWCARQGQRLARRPWDSKQEYYPRPFVNASLLQLLGMERWLLRHMNFPFGTSLTCLARRPGR